jgi:hypothetical protein
MRFNKKQVREAAELAVALERQDWEDEIVGARREAARAWSVAYRFYALGLALGAGLGVCLTKSGLVDLAIVSAKNLVEHCG